jgi:hypothetical protein
MRWRDEGESAKENTSGEIKTNIHHYPNWMEQIFYYFNGTIY